MPTEGKLLSSRCPECGAPVDLRKIDPGEAHVQCRYCGTQILISGRRKIAPTPGAPKAAVPLPRSPKAAVPLPRSSEPRAPKNAIGGCLIAVLAIVLIATMGGAFFLIVVPSSTETLLGEVLTEPIAATFPTTLSTPASIFGAPWTIPSGENGPALALLKTWQGEKTQLIAYDPVAQRELWRSGTFSREYYEMSYTSGPSHIYLADQDRLIALDRASGAVAWQASAANKIQFPCDDSACVLRFGDRIVTLARDGSLQGFVAADGALAWTRRLNSTPRRILDAAGLLLVVDTDAENRAVVLLLDPASGDTLRQIAPACIRNGRPDRVHASEQFLLSPTGDSLYVLDSGTDACAWRYDLHSGATVWEYAPPQGSGLLPFAWSTSSALVAEDAVYFSVDKGDPALVVALDAQNGAARVLLEERRYDLVLNSARDGLMLVLATPSYDRDQRELWAVDTAAGTRRWTYRFRTGHAFDEIYIRHGENGIFVGQCLWEEDTCVFELLNAQTGASSGEAGTLQVPSATGDAAWAGDLLLLTLSGKLHGIDASSGAVTFTWP
jgi:outer membrane protein assembly factor BamB/DNA-directed RNA polymerase subunit RPC12/RpoP